LVVPFSTSARGLHVWKMSGRSNMAVSLLSSQGVEGVAAATSHSLEWLDEAETSACRREDHGSRGPETSTPTQTVEPTRASEPNGLGNGSASREGGNIVRAFSVRQLHADAITRGVGLN
jgi:hypothetical protein